jgi:hypothetical protein
MPGDDWHHALDRARVEGTRYRGRRVLPKRGIKKADLSAFIGGAVTCRVPDLGSIEAGAAFAERAPDERDASSDDSDPAGGRAVVTG